MTKLKIFIESFVLLGLVAHSWSLYPSSSGVTTLTTSNFDDEVVNSHEIWFVHFYTPKCPKCSEFSSEFQKALKVFKGLVHFGAVNIDEEASLKKRFGISGASKAKFFNVNKSPIDYTDSPTLKNFVDATVYAILAKVDSQNSDKSKKYAQKPKKSSGGDENPVIALTDSNFDELVLKSDDIWMVEFFQPWCKYCQLLEPEWKKAAKELFGKVKFGALDGSSNQKKLAEYSIQGYPTIKFWAAGKKTPSNFMNYEGGRSAQEIVAWALEKYESNVPAPEVTQITTPDNFEENCSGKRLCIIAFLPHILDCNAECRNDYLKVFQKVADKYKKNQWGWVWSQGREQLELEKAIDVGDFGYPAVALINSEKNKYVLMRGSFSEQGITEFVKSLSFGPVHSNVIRGEGLPEIKSVEPWDGKDGVLIVDEEESYESDKEEL